VFARRLGGVAAQLIIGHGGCGHRVTTVVAEYS